MSLMISSLIQEESSGVEDHAAGGGGAPDVDRLGRLESGSKAALSETS